MNKNIGVNEYKKDKLRKKEYGMYDVSYGSSMLFENLPELLRPRYAAKVLGVSIKTIYDLKYRGEMRNIPGDLFLKINRSLYIRTDVLRRWVAS